MCISFNQNWDLKIRLSEVKSSNLLNDFRFGAFKETILELGFQKWMCNWNWKIFNIRNSKNKLFKMKYNSTFKVFDKTMLSTWNCSDFKEFQNVFYFQKCDIKTDTWSA